MNIKSKFYLFIIPVLIACLVQCSGMTRQEQTTLSGAAIGGVGGGILGEVVGNHPLAGAAIGAGIGALGGYIVGEYDHGYYREPRGRRR